MKKILCLMIIPLLIFPNVTFGAWWNPFSWFSQSLPVKVETKTEVLEKRIQELESKAKETEINAVKSAREVVETKLYVKYNNSRIRKCLSTECDVVGYLKINTEVIVQGDKIYNLSDLPEWINHTTEDGLKGYINKSILSETPVTNNTNELHPSRTGNEEKYNSMPLSAIDLSIKRIESDIRYNEKLVTNVNQIIKDAIERKDFVKNANIYNDAAFDLLVESDEKSIEQYKKYLSYFNALLNIRKGNLITAQQRRATISGHIYANEDVAKKEAMQILEQNTSEFGDALTRASDDFDKYHSKYRSEYKTALSILQSLTEANRPAPATYIPDPVYVPTAIPQIPFPKTTNCNIGPMSGARGYYTVSCY